MASIFAIRYKSTGYISNTYKTFGRAVGAAKLSIGHMKRAYGNQVQKINLKDIEIVEYTELKSVSFNDIIFQENLDNALKGNQKIRFEDDHKDDNSSTNNDNKRD